MTKFFKSLGLAFLTSLVWVLWFFLADLNGFMSGYDFLYIVVVFPLSVVCLTIIFLIYFSSEAFRKYIKIGLMVFFGAAFLWLLVPNLVGGVLTLLMSDRPPRDAADYSENLGKKKHSFGQSEAVYIATFANDYDYYRTVALLNENNEMIFDYYEQYDGEVKRTIKKINSNGYLVDSLVFNTDEEIFVTENHVVNLEKDFYTEWSKNASKTPIPIEIVNQNITMTKEETQNYIKKQLSYSCHSGDFDYQITADSTISVEKYLFENNGKYSVLYSKWNKYDLIDTEDYDKRNRNFENKSVFSMENYRNKKLEKQKSYLSYIQRERWDGDWEGKLYFKIPYNQDVLKIKAHSFLIDGTDKEDDYKYQKQLTNGNHHLEYTDQYMLYKNPKLNYQIFKDKHGKCYILRKRR